MKEQANSAAKRIGIKPSYLVVPPELEFTAIQLMKSGGLPGVGNNDINPIMGYCEVIVSPQLTNTVEWYLVADPRMVDTIEIGFVQGQVNPVLLVQDQPLFGNNFSNDVISSKSAMSMAACQSTSAGSTPAATKPQMNRPEGLVFLEGQPLTKGNDTTRR